METSRRNREGGKSQILTQKQEFFSLQGTRMQMLYCILVEAAANCFNQDKCAGKAVRVCRHGCVSPHRRRMMDSE